MGAGRKKEKRCHTVMPAGNSRQRRQQPALGHMSSVERPTRQGKSRRRQRAAAETRFALGTYRDCATSVAGVHNQTIK